MSRRSTHIKRSARALAEQTGMTYQQAHNVLTSTRDVPDMIPATPAMLAAFAERMVEAGTVESTWLPAPMRPETLTSIRTVTATENPLIVLLSDPTDGSEPLDFDLDFFDQPDKAERFLIHTDGLGLTTRDPNLNVTAVYRIQPANAQQRVEDVLWSDREDGIRLDVRANALAVAELRVAVRAHLTNPETVTSVEVTYDDTNLVGVHVYREGVWDTEFEPSTPFAKAVTEVMESLSDDAFEIVHEGNVGAYGADRRQFITRFRSPEAIGECDYCYEQVLLVFTDEDGESDWMSEDSEIDCPEHEGGHKVFDPARGFDEGACDAYLLDEANPDGDTFCQRCFHPADEHGQSIVMGQCPSCEQDRPFPVDQPGGCLFLPGSICPNCGHMEVESEVEEGEWLITLDREGTIRWIDEDGNTEHVFTIDDEDWVRFSGPLSATKALVMAALEGNED